MKKINICIFLLLMLSLFAFNIAKTVITNFDKAFILGEEEPRVHSVGNFILSEEEPRVHSVEYFA